jgi:hypothetical protein
VLPEKVKEQLEEPDGTGLQPLGIEIIPLGLTEIDTSTNPLTGAFIVIVPVPVSDEPITLDTSIL